MTHRPLRLVLGILLVCGCSDSSGGKDGSVTELGKLQIKVDYGGTLTKDAKVVAALIGCPFVMPPKAYGDFPISASKLEGELTNIRPGDYCATAFIDMIPGDGGSASGWVGAVDPAAVVDPSDPPIKVTIEAGKTTSVTMTFTMKKARDGGVPDKSVKDSFVIADGTTPGPGDVWIDLTVNCPTCKTGGAFVFYGMLGPSLPVAMPEMYNKILNPTAWPLTLLLKSTSSPTALNLPRPFPAAEVTVKGFHDADGMNYEGPDPDEPRSDPKTLTLQKGVLNKLTLDLKLP